MKTEDFFDLRIATIEPDEDPPPDVDWVRVEDPPRLHVAARVPAGWFYKPSYVSYVIRTPDSVDRYLRDSFRSRARNKPRRLLRQAAERYPLFVGEAERDLDAFVALYRRTIVARPRGKDRVSEHEEGFGRDWLGFYLREGERLIAGLLVHAGPDHLSVGYGAFDPAHRDLDLEHFLIMKTMERAGELGLPWVTLGMDTNRYGHHLPLGLPAYKLRIGFTPIAWEPAGRELVRVARFDVFEEGLFFYSYVGDGLEGHLFTRGEPDLRPFRHHTAPPIRTHRIVDRESG